MNPAFRLLLLTLFIVPLALYTGTKDHFLIKETLTLVLLLPALGFFLAAVIEKKIKPAVNPALIGIAIFLAAELGSVFNAKFPGLAIYTLLLHLCLGFCFIFASGMNSDETKTILDTILVAGLITAAYGVFQHFGYDFFSWVSQYDNRPASSFGNPNFFAGYLIILLPLAIAMVLQSAGLRKISWLALVFLLIACLIFNRTRGAWIACAVSLVFMAALLAIKNKKALLIAGTICLLLCGFFALNKIAGYRQAALSSQPPAVAERLFKWRTALEMIKQHPFIGVGAGNLKVNFALYQSITREKTGFGLRGTSESNVHNEFLQVFAETGALGLSGFLLIFACYFLTLKNPDKLNTGIAAGVLAFLVFCLTNFPFRIMPTAVTLLTLMGISAQSARSVKKTEPKLQKRGNFLIRLAVFFACVFTIYQFALIPFTADIYRKAGDDAVKTADYLKAAVDVQKAAYYYEKSISLDKARSEKSAFDLGELYRKTGRIDDAIRAYQVSVGVRNYGEVYNCLGNCYYMKNDFALAAKNWQIALKLGLPRHEDVELVERNLQIVKKKIE
ncbi:MAG: hypothetical protein A2297_07085 [Elusimicrobia bacterium RIFOXYB2_FULL_48_7]|nr:MAG: hypothetical protein A2297_07085 [Elusimicrobia bacterium RIFOXYB2_FULL_48_7]